CHRMGASPEKETEGPPGVPLLSGLSTSTSTRAELHQFGLRRTVRNHRRGDTSRITLLFLFSLLLFIVLVSVVMTSLGSHRYNVISMAWSNPYLPSQHERF